MLSIYVLSCYNFTLLMLKDIFHLPDFNTFIISIPCVHGSLLLSWFNFNSLRPSDAYMRRQSNHHWFRLWLVAWSAPSHYLNQCWIIINSNHRNKLRWNPRRNSSIFILENAFENVVCEMASTLSRPQWVNPSMNYVPSKAWDEITYPFPISTVAPLKFGYG